MYTNNCLLGCFEPKSVCVGYLIPLTLPGNLLGGFNDGSANEDHLPDLWLTRAENQSLAGLLSLLLVVVV